MMGHLDGIAQEEFLAEEAVAEVSGQEPVEFGLGGVQADAAQAGVSDRTAKAGRSSAPRPTAQRK